MISIQVFGIATVILTGLFTGYYWGGFAWRSDPGLQFNWHPLLMSIGMIYFYGNGKFTSIQNVKNPQNCHCPSGQTILIVSRE